MNEEDSIVTDESQPFETLQDAEEAILARWEASDESPDEPEEEEESSEEAPESVPTETDEEEVTEESDDDSEADPDEEVEEVAAADDDAVVEYVVDGETKQASVAELKRLAGQEAALTRKSQEVAAQRKQWESQALTNLAVLQKMQAKAMERFQPYANIDLFAASREMDPADFEQLRMDVAKAQADVQFFEQEIGSFSEQVQQAQTEALKAQAAEAMPVIKERIPEWNQELYRDIRSFAVDTGMDPEVVNNLVDPAAIEIIHKARLYDQLKSKSKAKVKKVVKRMPKKVVKSTNSSPSTDDAVNKTRKKLAQSGSLEDAQAAFLAKWESTED